MENWQYVKNTRLLIHVTTQICDFLVWIQHCIKDDKWQSLTRYKILLPTILQRCVNTEFDEFLANLKNLLKNRANFKRNSKTTYDGSIIQWWSLKTRALCRDCLETLFFMSRSWLSLDTCMSCLGSVSSFRVSSCLVSHDCVLNMSLSGLFCVETVAFRAKNRPLCAFTCFSPTVNRLFLRLLLLYGYNVSR